MARVWDADFGGGDKGSSWIVNAFIWFYMVWLSKLYYDCLIYVDHVWDDFNIYLAHLDVWISSMMFEIYWWRIILSQESYFVRWFSLFGHGIVIFEEAWRRNRSSRVELEAHNISNLSPTRSLEPGFLEIIV